jgi:hypothetical protein
MINSPLYLNSKNCQVTLPFLTAQNKGLKGNAFNKKVVDVIRERKKFYSSLCSSPEGSPGKGFSLERIRFSLGKIKSKQVVLSSSKEKKQFKKIKTHNRQLSTLEVKALSGVLHTHSKLTIH